MKYGKPLRAVQDCLTDVSKKMESSLEQSSKVTGLASHFKDFDRLTGGLRRGDLIIVAGLPGTGKSSFITNIAQRASVREGAIVAFFSLELNATMIMQRFLAIGSCSPLRRLASGFLSRDDKKKVLLALDEIASLRLFLNDSSSITVSQIRKQCEQIKLDTGNVDLIVVDCVHLVRAGYRRHGIKIDNRTQEISYISRALKAIAKDLDVPVLVTSQLSRKGESRPGDHRPWLADMRDSGSLECDADMVCFVHRPELFDRDNEDLKGKAEIMVAKHRNGPLGTIHLAFIAEWLCFENLDLSKSSNGSPYESVVV